MKSVYGIADNMRCRKSGKAARMIIDESNHIVYQCLVCGYEGPREPHFEFTTNSGTILRSVLEQKPRKAGSSDDA